MRSSRALLRPAVLIGLLGLTVSAIASYLVVGRANDAPAPQGDVSPTPGSAAMRATIDPETGALAQGHQTVNKADSPELKNRLSRSTEGLVPVHHPDGRVSVDLQGRFQSASMARIDSNGKLHTTCVDNHDAALTCQGKHTTPQTAEER